MWCVSFFLTTPAEFPCGRTALAAVKNAAYTRSVLNTTAPKSTNTTTSLPSTPASTTNDTAVIQSRKRLPPWVYSDARPTEGPPRPHKRIVGGEVVIPGEIPWQVLCVELWRMMCMACYRNCMKESKIVGTVCSSCYSCSLVSPFYSGSLDFASQRWVILRGLHSQWALGYHCCSLPGGGARLLLCQSG